MRHCSLRDCQLEITPTDTYRMVATERPYFNVFFHKNCFEELMEEVEDENGLELYLKTNLDLWFKRKPLPAKKRRRKR